MSLNNQLALLNIPRLQRCDFQGICEKIGVFLSPDEFDNLLAIRSILPKISKPAPLNLLPHFEVELDDSWWLQDEDDWEPYEHLSEQDYNDYLYDRSFREY